jgi:hypothetical protein
MPAKYPHLDTKPGQKALRRTPEQIAKLVLDRAEHVLGDPGCVKVALKIVPAHSP